jgi:hypothetical protein
MQAFTNPGPGQASQTAIQASGNGFSIGAIVLGVLAVFFLPIILGPAGLVLGFVGKSKGEKLSQLAIVVAGCGTVLGFILGALAFAALSG